jgi:predicted transcriptional regulator
MDIRSYLDNQGYNFNDKVEVIRACADAIVNLGETQKNIAFAIGVSPRTIRNYIAENKPYYEACLSEFEAKLSGKTPKLTEADLDAYMNNVIMMGTKANPNVKEMEFFATYFGITAEQITDILNIKTKTFRGYMKETEIDFLDKRDMATVLESMDVLYFGTKETKGATQKFVDMDIQDDLTKLRLMYAGLLFMSLFNGVEHPDLGYMGDLVRIEQIKQGADKPVNKKTLREMVHQKGTKEPVSKEEFIESLVDVLDFSPEEAKALCNAPKKQAQVYIPDKETVEIEAGHNREDLQVFLSAEEEIEAFISNKNLTQRGY